VVATSNQGQRAGKGLFLEALVQCIIWGHGVSHFASRPDHKGHI